MRLQISAASGSERGSDKRPLTAAALATARGTDPTIPYMQSQSAPGARNQHRKPNLLGRFPHVHGPSAYTGLRIEYEPESLGASTHPGFYEHGFLLFSSFLWLWDRDSFAWHNWIRRVKRLAYLLQK